MAAGAYGWAGLAPWASAEVSMHRFSRRFVCAALFCGAVLTVARGQSSASTQRTDDRPFALVFDGMPVSYNGTGTDSRNRLKQYVEAHPGRYLVFEERGSLYRLDDSAAVAAAERQLAAMRPLEAQEQALSAQQKPLEQRMRELSQKMKAAHTAEEQGSIGGQMSSLGNQMGKIGGEQGRVGNQIGAMGNAFYQSVEAMFAKCLANGGCKRL